MEDFKDPNISETNHNDYTEDAIIPPEEYIDTSGKLEEAEVPEEEFKPFASGAYRGVGAGRRESPFADSPYVMKHAVFEEEYDEFPEEEWAGTPNPFDPYEEYRSISKREPGKREKKGFGRKLLAVVAALALVAGSCGITVYLVNQHWETRVGAMESAFSSQLQELQSQVNAMSPQITGNSVSGTVSLADGLSAGQVYARNVQSVVLIESTVTASMYGQTATGISAGSGFILSEDGYVVTNYHVIEGASSVEVAMYDGTRYQAAVVGYDSTNDVAVLKIQATGLTAVTLGSSSDLIVGDQVVAIGNPLGELTSTLTVGYVSAKERDVSTDGTIINMLQTDCAINSGNSGGPLFNMKGEVVGITTAKYSGSSSSGATIEGIGFAIPIDDVLEGIGELIEFGYVKSAYLGVSVRDMDASTAEIYGLPIGAYVISAEEGYAAQRAGIQAKDIITAVEDTTIETIADLTRALRDYEPGDSVRVHIYRGGMYRVVQVTLDERPQNVEVVVPEAGTGSEMPEGNFED